MLGGVSVGSRSALVPAGEDGRAGAGLRFRAGASLVGSAIVVVGGLLAISGGLVSLGVC